METVEKQITDGVAVANVPTLLMVLVQLTGDLRWLEPPYRVRRAQGIDENDSGGLSAEAIGEVRRAAERAISHWFRTGEMSIPHPSEELLVRMMAAAMGESVAAEYGPMIAYDLDLVTRSAASTEKKTIAVPDGFHVAVIGAGAGGICAAVRLKEAGIPYTIVERADGIGGVWWANRYPGAGVDIPNHLYSFTFANYDFSRYFVLQDELQRYLEDVVQRFDLAPNLRLGTTVRSARYDDAGQRWDLEIDGPNGTETLTANVVFAASGLFNPPKWPDIEGLDSFAGITVHTAEWIDGLDLRDKRVGVVGSGASAMQTVPAIVDEVASLTVFQRSPTWAAPFAKFQMEIPAGERFLFQAVPLYRAWYRLRLNWMWSDRLLKSFHRDPEWPHPERSMNATNDRHRQFFTDYIASELGERTDLLSKLVPEYPPYGKRILLDNGWYRTMTRDHVTLVVDPIARVEPRGVRTATGELHQLDVLILATGFDVQRFLSTFEILGRDGLNLRDVWGDDDARAYLGTAIPGFPNFFCLYGPNSQSGAGGSIMALLEAQVNYALSAIEQMLARNMGALEVRQATHDAYNARLEADLKDTVWTHPGVSNYFRNSSGRVTVNSGIRKVDFWRMTREANLDDFMPGV